MDALSEVLNAVRMTGAIFLNAEFTAPWGFEAPLSRDAAQVLAPGTERLVSYHLVTQGTAWLQLPGEPALRVQAGEIVVIPHGEAHLFYNGAPERVFSGAQSLGRYVAGELRTLRWGGGGAPTHFVCGYMGCERQAEKLFLAGLPRAIKVDIRGDATGAWIENSVRHLVSESQAHQANEANQAGRHILLSKMAEALFIETLRRYLRSLAPGATGWLAGARDPIAGATLALLHQRPAEAWTLERLAETVGASRSVVAERFTRHLGEPPLAYLARWRMQLAARQLETTRDTVLQVGLAVGYESESAFVRAFKRELGLPPARYRRRAGQEGAPTAP